MISETLTRPPPPRARPSGSSRSSIGTQPLVAGTDVFGLRPDQAVVRVLLADVRGPAGGPPGGEHRREQVRGQAEGVKHRGHVEVDVGVQALLVHHHLLDPLADVEPLRVAGVLAELPGQGAQDRRAGILGLVDAVAEAHDPFLPGEQVLHEAVRALRLADLLEHAHGLLVRPSVQRSLQRGDGGHNARVHVRKGRSDHPGAERGCVHGVVDVGDEGRVHGVGHLL